MVFWTRSRKNTKRNINTVVVVVICIQLEYMTLFYFSYIELSVFKNSALTLFFIYLWSIQEVLWKVLWKGSSLVFEFFSEVFPSLKIMRGEKNYEQKNKFYISLFVLNPENRIPAIHFYDHLSSGPEELFEPDVFGRRCGDPLEKSPVYHKAT